MEVEVRDPSDPNASLVVCVPLDADVAALKAALAAAHAARPAPDAQRIVLRGRVLLEHEMVASLRLPAVRARPSSRACVRERPRGRFAANPARVRRATAASSCTS
jgi:hypothetical protein